MRRILKLLIAAAVLGAAGFFWLTIPTRDAPEDFAGVEGDETAGEAVFIAAGCSSCHSAPEAKDTRVLAGGQRFPSEFGTFVAPNISMHPEAGIGRAVQGNLDRVAKRFAIMWD